MQEWNLFDERGWQVHWATEKVYFLDFEFFFFYKFSKKKIENDGDFFVGGGRHPERGTVAES